MCIRDSTGSVPEDSGINGFAMFLQTIPNNLYALLTIVMCLTLAIGKFDYGPMKIHEDNARDKNDLFTTPDRPYGEGLGDVKPNANGKVIDLVLPVVVLIFCCIMGMVYTCLLYTSMNNICFAAVEMIHDEIIYA